MSVPVAASVRRAYPDADIWWAVESRCAAVIERGKLVSGVQEFDRETWKKHKFSPRVWRDQIQVFSSLRKQRFDYGIDLQGHSKTAICLKFAAPKKKVSAHATDIMARLMNPVVKGDIGTSHMVEWNLRTLKALGDFPTEPRWIMPALTSERAHMQTLGSNLATIAVSAGQSFKSYPKEKWAVVAKELLGQGYKVIFLGGPTDQAPKVDGALDWVGKTGLSETMAAVAESQIHFAADTGTGHMAAAYGVPVVSVFGPTPPERFAPYTDKRIVLRKVSQVTADITPEEILEASQTLRSIYETALPH